MKFVSSVPYFLLAVAVKGQDMCNRNGGSLVVYDGECNSRNETYTDQCLVVQNAGQCEISSKDGECGCQIIDDKTGFSSGIGGGTKDCPTACITVSDDVPLDRTCQASGVSVSFEGKCDSRGHTLTPQCKAEEVENASGGVDCFITERECGCLYWTPDNLFVAGIEAKPDKCDACAVHGFEEKDTSGSVVAGDNLNQIVIGGIFALYGLSALL